MPSHVFTRRMQRAIDERKQQQLIRHQSVVDDINGASIQVGGETYLNFSGNDYLGLSQHPAVKSSFIRAAEKYGVGSGASHLVTGHQAEHQELEMRLQHWLGVEKVLLFSTGYMANVALLSAVLSKNDLVLQDKLNHASLIDGGLHSGATFKRFPHLDLDRAQQILASSDAEVKALVTDGVFSMDGDVFPVQAALQLAQDHDALLIVDDAHGLGVLGDTGKGVIEAAGCQVSDVDFLMGTFGKAFGTAGAFVAGSSDNIDYLLQFARPYIYTTAMPPAVAAATTASLSLIENDVQLRNKLNQNIQYFKQQANSIGLNLLSSDSAIQPILVGDNLAAMQLMEYLRQKGIWATAIRPPTVPKGTARIRITMSALHEVSSIDYLLESISECISRCIGD